MQQEQKISGSTSNGVSLRSAAATSVWMFIVKPNPESDRKGQYEK